MQQAGRHMQQREPLQALLVLKGLTDQAAQGTACLLRTKAHMGVKHYTEQNCSTVILFDFSVCVCLFHFIVLGGVCFCLCSYFFEAGSPYVVLPT